MEKELIDFINELEVKCKEEYEEIKAEAYNVRLEDNYAIVVRDKFSKNDGKFEILSRIKRKILELADKEDKQ